LLHGSPALSTLESSRLCNSFLRKRDDISQRKSLD
jgi:hypothetical protein